MPRAHRSRSGLAALALALTGLPIGLAGCGGDDTLRWERPALSLTLDEYRIVPQDISIPPRRIKFVVHNGGRSPHNLFIQQIPDDGSDPPIEMGRVDTMQPGETAEPIKLTLAPGEYRLVCTIANHDDLGQYGTLRVEE